MGKEQANALGDHIRMHRIPIQLVVVSPLRRTLETATQAFGTSVPMVAVELVRARYARRLEVVARADAREHQQLRPD